MAAALAAAEAALEQDAAAADDSSMNQHQQYFNQMDPEMVQYMQEQGFGPDSDAMSQGHAGGEQGFGDDGSEFANQDLLQELMQYQDEGGEGGEDVEYMMQLMAQQEQQQKAEAAAQAARRPTEHYMTIAHDGEWTFQ